MSFPRYKQYKDSGVEWLGEVPEHWKLGKLHHIAILNPAKAELGDIDPQTAISFLPMEAFGTKGDPSLSLERTISQVETGYTYFRDGDVAFAKVTPCFENGKRAIFSQLTNGIGFGTTELIVLRARSGQTAPKFLYWLVATSEFLGLGEGSMYGAGGLKRIPESFVHQLSVCIPGIDEQTFIVTFLDQETAKIDALIEEQRLLIELLKEKRQAVISHAVTKGLDPNAPMRNSEVDWISHIPNYWEISKLGQIASIVRGGSPRPAGDSRFFNGDYMPWITVGEVTKDDSMYLLATESMLTEVGAEQSRTIDSGTLVLTNSGATLGVPKILGIRGCANDGILAFLDLKTNTNKKYLYFVLSSLTAELRERMKQGSGQPNLNTGIVSALQVPLPPVVEQLAIVAKLERMQDEFAALMAQAETSVTLLQERRSALISAAVTGKIDVRNYTPKGAA